MLLAQFASYLIKGAIEAARGEAGKAGELATEKNWNKAQSKWGKLTKHEEVKKAAETVVKLPDNVDTLTALRLQIKLALPADPALVKILERFLA